MKNSKLLLEEIIDEQLVRDLALDYVEHEIGAYDLNRNWTIFCSKFKPVDLIAKWLEFVGINKSLAQAVYDEIEKMAQVELNWIGGPYRSKDHLE